MSTPASMYIPDDARTNCKINNTRDSNGYYAGAGLSMGFGLICILVGCLYCHKNGKQVTFITTQILGAALLVLGFIFVYLGLMSRTVSCHGPLMPGAPFPVPSLAAAMSGKYQT